MSLSVQSTQFCSLLFSYYTYVVSVLTNGIFIHSLTHSDVRVCLRRVQIHEFEDDLGRGNNSESLRSGNAGPRYGCCVIREVERNETMRTTTAQPTGIVSITLYRRRWLGSRVVSVLDSGAERSGFKSQSRCRRVTILGKLFTLIVPLFTKQRNWYQPS